MTDLYERLAARLGPKGYATDAAAIAPHIEEWRGNYHGATPFLALPANKQEVQDIVRLCAAAGAAITPQGGNTGLVAAQISQGEVLLSLKRMNRVLHVDPIDDAITVEAGATLAAVQQAAADVDRLFPLSIGSQGSATIGGNISTNAGGVHVLRYGMTRELVLGIEAVLPDGALFNGLSSLRKDNTGYDLKQLFIGAEGTLGVITAACLKLFPRPKAREVAMAAIATPEQALQLLHRVKAATGAVSAFELMNRLSVALTTQHIPTTRDPMPQTPYIALIEFETAAPEGLRAAVEAALTAALDANEAQDVLIAENETQGHAFWMLRESLSAGHRADGAPQVSCDVSVPVSAIPRFLEAAASAVETAAPGARIVAFGHIGDGNLHYTAMAPTPQAAAAFPREALNARIHELVVGLGGSISAEHGIGVARLADFARFKDPNTVAMMRKVKAALDPQRIMNPRVLLA